MPYQSISIEIFHLYGDDDRCRNSLIIIPYVGHIVVQLYRALQRRLDVL